MEEYFVNLINDAIMNDKNTPKYCVNTLRMGNTKQGNARNRTN